jgi:anti-sigma regulatory factor (Ser/Thr protein kinase)
MKAVHAFIWAVAQEAALNKKQAYRLRLVVEETVSNIITHGYGDCAESGPVQIWAEIKEETISVTIEDVGTPFDMTRTPPPNDLHLPPEERDLGGLGVFLVVQYADDLRYEHIDGHNINRFTIRRDTD